MQEVVINEKTKVSLKTIFTIVGGLFSLFLLGKTEIKNVENRLDKKITKEYYNSEKKEITENNNRSLKSLEEKIEIKVGAVKTEIKNLEKNQDRQIQILEKLRERQLEILKR